MRHSDEMVRCLVECDVRGMRRLWKHISPHTPQPENDADCLVGIHMARTQTNSLNPRLRYYSHRWLLDNGYPTALPDELRPAAERMYPKIVEGVGIAVKGASALTRPLVPYIRGAMEDAVREAYADGKTDPLHVKARMQEARQKTVDKLLGLKR